MTHDLFAAVVRGIRSRGLLSAGSVLLIALAVGSAVLGPVFQVAVSRSYVVSRLNEAPPPLTGLSRSFASSADLEGGVAAGVEQARASVLESDRGPFSAPRFTYYTEPTYSSLQNPDTTPGMALLLAKDGACDHLVITGRCPRSPGEALMLGGDLDYTGTEIGDRVSFEEGHLPAVRIVGTYRVGPGEEDYWFNVNRLRAQPRRIGEDSIPHPYIAAPLIVAPDAFEAVAAGRWLLYVDRFLHVPSDYDEQTLADVQASGAAVLDQLTGLDGGTLTGSPVGDVPKLLAEARAQEETARSSIAPAVLSLVLVALALLLRLLMAASEIRLPELALASLRGVRERGLWLLGVFEPLVLVMVGVPLGVLAGFAMSYALIRSWLVPGLPVPLPLGALGASALVAVAAAGVAVFAVGLVLNDSLSSQLTGVRRPRGTRRAALVVELVLIAAGVAILASKLSVSEPGTPDLTDMILPVVLAVSAGLIATRLISALARWRSRSSGRSLSGFVSARALGRRTEGTLVILPITAAMAVSVFAYGVYASAADWRHSVAVTASPADQLWEAPGPMSQTMALSRSLDPAGEHLMGVGVLTSPGTRMSVVDSSRMDDVLTWIPSWTPGVPAAGVRELIGSEGEDIVFSGADVGLTVDNRAVLSRPLWFELRLVADQGDDHRVYVGPFPEGVSTRYADARFCRSGCTLSAMALGAEAALQMQMRGQVVVRDVVSGGDVVPTGTHDAAWGESVGVGGVRDVSEISNTDEGVVVDLDTGDGQGLVRMVPGGIDADRPVAVGVDSVDRVDPDAGGFGALPIAGASLPVRDVLRAQSMPMLGPDGVLIDYRMLVSDRLIYDQTLKAHMATDASTPPSLKDELAEHGYTLFTSQAAQREVLEQGAYALALRLYAVVAVLVLLMAFAGLFVSMAVQLPARRRDAAALRVVGVPRRSVMLAAAREFAVVLGGAAVAGIAAGALAQYVVLRTVRLGYVETIATPALIARIDPAQLVVVVALAPLVLGGFALGTAVLTVRGARGATLRENAR